MKDYENFVARMGSFDMELTPPKTKQDTILHYGVKGMKWGVRRAGKAYMSAARKHESETKARREKGEVSSAVRNVKTLRDLKNVKSMTESDLKKRTERLRNENDLGRISKEKGWTKSQKKEFRKTYLDRGNMSDDELKAAVKRARLEDALRREVHTANTSNRKYANKVIQETSKLLVKAAIPTTGNPILDMMIKETINYTSKNNVIK